MKKIRGQTVHTSIERIERMISVDKKTECWNWTGTTRNGYGRLITGSRSDGSRRSVSAHRFSYECFNGKILEGLEICHKCDNRRCVNPKHLFAGSHQDNIDDRVKKGRCNHVRGEKVGGAKLTAVDVLSARRLRIKGHTYQSIADRFSVDKSTVMAAIKGENWSHLPQPPKEQL